MVRVAILGGSGHVGKTLAEVISLDSRHSVLVLGRRALQEVLPGVDYVSVDYTDVSAIASILEDHQIHTVISSLMLTQKSVADAEAATIAAANISPCTRRLIASNWGPPTKEASRDYAPWFPYQLASRNRLRETSLEWTEIVSGYFLDYWGMPYIKTNMTPDMPSLDIVHGVAGIPGTGNEPVSFTYTYDVARVVAEVLLLPEWESESIPIIGDRVTWNEFIALAETARGHKFQVSYDHVDELAKGEITELPNHRDCYQEFPMHELRKMYSNIGLMMARGLYDLDPVRSVHLKFPQVKMLTVGDMLRDIWELRHI